MNVNLVILRNIAKAIKNIDECSFISNEHTLNGKENVERLFDARKNLINIIFDNDYELSYNPYRLIKSKHKRNLI